MKFRKKPVEIQASQFNDTHGADSIIAWINGNGGNAAWFESDFSFRIKTLEGDHLATKGDWIIQGIAGEFYPCKPAIFAATYEPAE